MKRNKTLGMITGFLISASCFAQGSATGGGRGIVCFTSKNIANRILDWKSPRRGIVTESDIPYITNVETLDYYWAKEANAGVGLISYPASQDDYALVDAVRDRIYDGFPDVSKRLGYFSANHPGRDQIVRLANGMQQLDDAAETFVPDERCIVTTIARQSNQGDGIVLEIDDRLLSRMKDDYSKKALFLHESIYSWARSHGANKSDGVRTILARLISKQPLTKDFLSILKSNNMDVTDRMYPSVFYELFEKIREEIRVNIIEVAAKETSEELLSAEGFSTQAVQAIVPKMQKQIISLLSSKGYDGNLNFYFLGGFPTQSAVNAFFGSQSQQIDNLEVTYLRENQAWFDTSRGLAQCSTRSCRKELRQKLIEIDSRRTIYKRQWDEVKGYLSPFHTSSGVRTDDWIALSNLEKGWALGDACEKTDPKPEVISEFCKNNAQDLSAYTKLINESHVFDEKVNNLIKSKLYNFLRNSLHSDGALAELLKDSVLSAVPYNEHYLTHFVLNFPSGAVKFVYQYMTDQDEFIVP